MEWSTSEVVKASGVTSRTLRHYDEIGLLQPIRVGAGGMRYYSQDELLRLQRILALKELGLSLNDIAAVLTGAVSDIQALHNVLLRLDDERDRLARQIASIKTAIRVIQNEEDIMPDKIFDGFDHTKYDEEVRERWGDEAADRSNKWWEGLGDSGKQVFLDELSAINDAWDERIESGEPAESSGSQEVAAKHVKWIETSWNGTPVTGEALRGLAEMYVADERFAANYTRKSDRGAEYVRDCLIIFAKNNLS